MDNTHVLEWSQRLNSLLVHELELSLEKNLSAFIGDIKTDHIPLVHGTKAHCEKVKSELIERLKLREECRGPDSMQAINRRSYRK